MAAADEAAVKAVEIDGVEVEVDLVYMRSWAGVRQAALTQSSELNEGQRMAAMVEYYEHAVPNIDDVAAAVGESAPLDAVVAVVNRAIREATPKN